MSLPKRLVYDASSMGHPQLFEDSQAESVLFDVDMSSILGTFHQLIYVTAMVTETFDHLISLSDDVNERVKSVSKRINTLYQKLPSFETRVFSIEVNDKGHSGLLAKQKFFSQHDVYIPTVLSRSSNSVQIMSQYDSIQRIPPFWKLLPVTQQDTTKFYSNPGYFFQEWLKEEYKRQLKLKEEQKKQKFIRKQMRAEKKQKLLLKSRVQYDRGSDLIQAEESKRDAITSSPDADVMKQPVAESSQSREELAQRLMNNKMSGRFQLPGLMAAFGNKKDHASEKKALDAVNEDEDDEDNLEEDGMEVKSRLSEKSNTPSSPWNSMMLRKSPSPSQKSNAPAVKVTSSSPPPRPPPPPPRSGPSSLFQAADADVSSDIPMRSPSPPPTTRRQPATARPLSTLDQLNRQLQQKLQASASPSSPTAATAIGGGDNIADMDDIQISVPMNMNSKSSSNRQANQYTSKPNVRLNATNISSAAASNTTATIRRESLNAPVVEDRHLLVASSNKHQSQGGKKLLNSLFKSMDIQDPITPAASDTLASNPTLRRASESLAGTNINDNSNAAKHMTVKENLQRLSIVLSKSSAMPASADAIDINSYATTVRDTKAKSKAFNFDPVLPKSLAIDALQDTSANSTKTKHASSHLSTSSSKIPAASIPMKPESSHLSTSPTSSSKRPVSTPVKLPVKHDEPDDEPDSPPPDDDDDDLLPPDDDEPPLDDDDEPPVEVKPKFTAPSPLNMNILSQIKKGPELKHIAAPAIKVDPRGAMLSAIKKGAVELKKVEIDMMTKVKDTENQNVAIAAILANRSKIAGDSESDDSDSNFSDDDYG